MVCLALSACAGDVTEIVIVVDTDLTTASHFRIEARFPSGGTATSDADLREIAAPRRLVLLHTSGDLGPIELTVSALDGSTELVSVERQLAFEPGQTLTLRVFLHAQCRTLACPDTCSNEGACRSRVVRSCEYEGRVCDRDAGLWDASERVDGGSDAGLDAGPRFDAGPDAGIDAGLDAGIDAGIACTGVSDVCGVADTHLPGDRVTPYLCSAPASVTVVDVLAPSGAPIVGTGSPSTFPLNDFGAYIVRVQDAVSSCFHERTIRVNPALMIADVADVSQDSLRDIAARVGTAFVAGRGGAYAVDPTGWFDLRASAIAGGDVAPENQRAVVVVGATPFFGPDRNVDGIHRIEATAPFSSATHTRIGAGQGIQKVRLMSVRVGNVAPIAMVSQGVIMTITTPLTTPAIATLGSRYGADAWIANGALESPTLGAVWAGQGDEGVNRAIGSGGQMNGGSAFDLPSFLGRVNGAAVDDRGTTRPNLWLCGQMQIGRFDFDAMDWTAASSLPTETARRSGRCEDIAIDLDGEVWIAGAASGLTRTAPDATTRVVVAPGRGLPADTSVDFLAVTSDATAREVWILDAENRRVLRFAADPLP